MKKLLIFFALLPTFLYAGVIVKQSGERLEDVTIKFVTESEIIYIINGNETTLPKSEASAILYDDGRYEEIVNTENLQPLNQNEYLLHGADVTSDLVILGIFVDMVNIANAKKFHQQLEHYYYLCISKEDMNAYKTYLKGHRDIRKRYDKVLKNAKNYEAALQASRVYQEKRKNGANSEETCAALINTFIENSNK